MRGMNDNLYGNWDAVTLKYNLFKNLFTKLIEFRFVFDITQFRINFNLKFNLI